MTTHEAYEAMKAADDKFHAALVAAYGKRAGDMRYHTKKQKPEIQALGAAFRAASAAWHATLWTADSARTRVGGTIGT